MCRFEACSVCSVVPKERERPSFAFQSLPSPFPISCAVAVAAFVAVKRTGISLLGGKKWPHTSLRAFFLLPLFLSCTLSLCMQGEKGEDWRRAPKLRCDVCPMIALSFTASLLLQLFFELLACENITSALPHSTGRCSVTKFRK